MGQTISLAYDPGARCPLVIASGYSVRCRAPSGQRTSGRPPFSDIADPWPMPPTWHRLAGPQSEKRTPAASAGLFGAPGFHREIRVNPWFVPGMTCAGLPCASVVVSRRARPVAPVPTASINRATWSMETASRMASRSALNQHFPGMTGAHQSDCLPPRLAIARSRIALPGGIG